MITDTEQLVKAGHQYRKWMKEAYFKGYHPSYGSAKFIEKYEEPVTNKGVIAKGAVFGDNPTWEHKQDYLEHLVKQVNRKGGPFHKAEEYYIVEFGEKPEVSGLEVVRFEGMLRVNFVAPI